MLPESRHLRSRDGGAQATTTLELFFDLVYVFAVTQLSHLLIDDLTWAGAARTGFLLLVVWWAWIYTTWMVNWFDPASIAVRLVLLGAMLASLMMSVAIPDAFHGKAALFAGSYVVLQVGRNVAGMSMLGRDAGLRRSFERIVFWSLLTSVPWIAGALVPAGGLRIALWSLALALDLVAPIVGYATPRLGRSGTADWPVEGAHFAERFQAFIIIALGESIVVAGATASAAGLDRGTVTGLVLAFVQTATLWWLYFGEIAERAARRIAESDDPGALARDAYTYLHLPIVAGIIVAAVGDELVILHPGDHPHAAEVLVLVAGPAMYLLGESLVRLRMAGSHSSKRLLTVGLLLLVAVPATSLPVVVTYLLATAVLIALAAWEHG